MESTGASSGDTWLNATGTYSHSSDDRNRIWSAKLSVSNEFDYFSFGFGGGYTWLFNEKNTELSLHGNIYLDTWYPVYPYELRPGNFSNSSAYNPVFTPFTNDKRNSYSAGFVLSQILSKRLQGSLAADYILQKGLLSTPFQRVYFKDFNPVYVDNFRLADDVERLPDSRYKVAFGGRLHYYINQVFVARFFYRYYFDEWGIESQTVNLELPVKISGSFTLYPSYRYYSQTAADYFAPYAAHSSDEQYYTSDYDLSGFSANQFGFGVSYTDIFTKFHISRFGLKSVDLKYYRYSRNINFNANLIEFGCKFIMD